jgi:hypothetical protein
VVKRASHEHRRGQLDPDNRWQNDASARSPLSRTVAGVFLCQIIGSRSGCQAGVALSEATPASLPLGAAVVKQSLSGQLVGISKLSGVPLAFFFFGRQGATTLWGARDAAMNDNPYKSPYARNWTLRRVPRRSLPLDVAVFSWLILIIVLHWLLSSY